MSGWSPETERKRHETVLGLRPLSISAAYVILGNLRSLIGEHPAVACPETVRVLGRIITGTEYTNQRQAYFLYKAAAEAMTDIICRAPDRHLTEQALALLLDIIATGAGPAHRATAEALGALPVAIEGPSPEIRTGRYVPPLGWRELLKRAGGTPAGPPVRAGRSLVVPLAGQDRAAARKNGDAVLVVKCGRNGDGACLHSEAAWSDFLGERCHHFSGRFEVPRPVPVRNGYLFKPERLPVMPEIEGNGQPKAIAFVVHPDYFTYPNDHRPGRRLSPDRFRDVLFRNARLMGEMTGMGIIQTAPIPLFHNRVQQNRRADGGLYEWHRGGRLDRWLFSCRYPNFGLSGLRDFEHLVALERSGTPLYRHIGTQLLSLALVAGSYFRNREPQRIGFAAPDQGEPVDARDLFDPDQLRELMAGICSHFFTGFTGGLPADTAPLRLDALIPRMIDEMGVDRHMTEILRVADQTAMSDEEFRDHLTHRGMTPAEIDGLRKGEREIVLHTGPHLGNFNQRISLPEIITFLETAAALCIAHRFRKEQRT